MGDRGIRPVSGEIMSVDDAVRLRAFVDQVASSGALRLPPEPRLSEELGVSRGRLRTLLKRLEDEGVIWRHVGKGTFVGPRQPATVDLEHAASISLDDAVQARLALEPQLAAQAALRAKPQDVVALEQCLAEMAQAPTLLLWKRLDEKLHRTMAQATHNDLLILLYDVLRSQVKLGLDTRIEHVYGAAPGPREESDNSHRQIVEAIALHDPARAEQAMRRHLHAVRASLFGLD